MKVQTIRIKSDNEEVIKGLNDTVDIIKSTMGAKGKFVTINENGETTITKDGVSVANAITLPGLEGIGCNLVKSSARKTVQQVGDGTTATSVLLQALVNKSKLYLVDDINTISKDMELAVEAVLDYVESYSNDLNNDFDKLEQIASIASNSQELGKMIADCYKEISMDSIITLEKSAFSPKTYYEIRKGIEFNSGMVHSKFSNSHGERCIFENPLVFIESKEIRGFTEVHSKILGKALNEDQPVIIIAPNFSKQFITTCLTNKDKRQVPICLVRTPGFGDNLKENVKDITAYTDKGRVDKVVITREKISFFNEPTESLTRRIDELTKNLDVLDDEYEAKKSLNRIHKLKGTSAIIYTGGVTVEAQDEEYDRLEDALGSVRASMKGGYVAGGGTVLYKASKALYDKSLPIGYKIVLEACKAPIMTILSNANLNPEVVLGYFDLEDPKQGYDVITNEYKDMVAQGIIDPTLVVKEALTNAFASTKLLINTKYNLINKV